MNASIKLSSFVTKLPDVNELFPAEVKRELPVTPPDAVPSAVPTSDEAELVAVVLTAAC